MAYTITEDCVICGTCWEICPTQSIVAYDWYYKITDTCVECGACARVCPNTAIIKGKEKQQKQSECFDSQIR
jgi:NAD-dependent dihydropyrimidine dehydrogenase PreA subunit